jgi:hypothetical protein
MDDFLGLAGVWVPDNIDSQLLNERKKKKGKEDIYHDNTRL